MGEGKNSNKTTFIKTATKGMCDFLPSDVRVREYVLNLIKENYAKFGFMQIETPCVEHIENLTSKQGGDNEKLIYKILKRGMELTRELEKGTQNFADSGLRYDLTVPLARYFSNNMQNLPTPFKALQIGNVWRAENPQKGRFRQFVQCDIDILGDASNTAEIELILATSDSLCKILSQLEISGLTIHINDRRILFGSAKSAGFSDEEIPQVLISLDKLDKIGLDGVEKELLENGYDREKVEKYISIYKNISEVSCKDFCSKISSDVLGDDVAKNLEDIISCVTPLLNEKIKIVFDPKLVRGMGYYTGPVFEVTLDDYNFSIAGGGRYDAMIGKFVGRDVPATGFSIGFERIITILKDKLKDGAKIKGESLAILFDEKISSESKINVFKEAKSLRDLGKTVIVQQIRKNMKKQIEELEKEGIKEFKKVFE